MLWPAIGRDVDLGLRTTNPPGDPQRLGHLPSSNGRRTTGSPAHHPAARLRQRADLVTRDDVLDRCGCLPGAVEDYPFGEGVAVFKVGGKMFALVPLEGSPASVNLKCDPELALELRARNPSVLPGYHQTSGTGTRSNWTGPSARASFGGWSITLTSWSSRVCPTRSAPASRASDQPGPAHQEAEIQDRGPRCCSQGPPNIASHFLFSPMFCIGQNAAVDYLSSRPSLRAHRRAAATISTANRAASM